MQNQENIKFYKGMIVSDPILKITSKGSYICSFAIKSISYFKKNNILSNKVDYYLILTSGKFADACSEYLSKGKSIQVKGMEIVKSRFKKIKIESEIKIINAFCIDYLPNRGPSKKSPHVQTF